MSRKKILLVCKETTAMAMHFLAKLLREEDADLRAFFILAHEPLVDAPYYQFFRKMNPDIPIDDVKEPAQKLIQDVADNTLKLDEAYLERVEKIYSAYRGINLQFMSSQFHSSYYHYIDYYYTVPYEQHLKWLELYYKQVEKMLDEFNPDVIYDADTAELGRVILLEVAHSRGIPYVNAEHSRIGDYYIPSDTQGLKVFAPFRQKYEFLARKYASSDLKTSPGFRYLAYFRAKKEILPNDYKLNNPLFKKWNVFAEFLKVLSSCSLTFSRWLKVRKIQKTPTLLYSDYFKVMKVDWIIFVRNCLIRWFEKKYFVRVETKGLKYILFPLHLIPESSTFTYAPYFCTEIFIIESLAKSVPWNVKILVKEHWSMLGQRPLSFYKKLQQLPNVILVSPFQTKDPKQFIADSLGVVTITGTTALEAAFLGKPSIVFGPVSYEVLSCISKISDVTQMASIIAAWTKGETRIYDYELTAYIDAVFKFGREISLKTLFVQNPEMDVSQEKGQWIKSTSKSLLKRRVFRFLGLGCFCSPPAEGMEPKVREQTLKLKELFDLASAALSIDKAMLKNA